MKKKYRKLEKDRDRLYWENVRLESRLNAVITIEVDGTAVYRSTLDEMLYAGAGLEEFDLVAAGAGLEEFDLVAGLTAGVVNVTVRMQ